MVAAAVFRSASTTSFLSIFRQVELEPAIPEVDRGSADALQGQRRSEELYVRFLGIPEGSISRIRPSTEFHAEPSCVISDDG